MLEIIIGVLTLCYLVYLYLIWNYNYWEKRQIPHIKPSLLFGNIKSAILAQESFVHLHKRIYETYKNCRYCGYYFFRQPAIFVRDPAIVKQVLISEFSNFHDNNFVISDKVDPLMGRNPFLLKGKEWKLVRGQIIPALTGTRIKNMFPQMMEVGDRLVKYVGNNMNKEDGLLAKEICACYTTDVVGAAALGINAKSFDDPNAEFREAGRQMLEPKGFFKIASLMIRLYLPVVADLLHIKMTPDTTKNILQRIVNDIVEYRKKNNIVVNDYLDHLLQLKEKCKEYVFDDNHVIAHIITFFTDGYETSSVVFQYALYELAKNPNVLQKLREEIHQTLYENNDELTFETVHQMPYLDCVINETLRKYPPLIFMWKKCTEPTTIPHYLSDDNPPIKIERGTQVIIPVNTIHHDAVLYPKPEVFDPERFSEGRKDEIPKNAFLPFGDGPRVCLGNKFGIAQIKVGVVKIAMHFNISVNPKTIEPLEPLPESLLLAPKGGIWLDFSKVE